MRGPQLNSVAVDAVAGVVLNAVDTLFVLFAAGKDQPAGNARLATPAHVITVCAVFEQKFAINADQRE